MCLPISDNDCSLIVLDFFDPFFRSNDSEQHRHPGISPNSGFRFDWISCVDGDAFHNGSTATGVCFTLIPQLWYFQNRDFGIRLIGHDDFIATDCYCLPLLVQPMRWMELATTGVSSSVLHAIIHRLFGSFGTGNWAAWITRSMDSENSSRGQRRDPWPQKVLLLRAVGLIESVNDLFSGVFNPRFLGVALAIEINNTPAPVDYGHSNRVVICRSHSIWSRYVMVDGYCGIFSLPFPSWKVARICCDVFFYRYDNAAYVSPKESLMIHFVLKLSGVDQVDIPASLSPTSSPKRRSSANSPAELRSSRSAIAWENEPTGHSTWWSNSLMMIKLYILTWSNATVTGFWPTNIGGMKI